MKKNTVFAAIAAVIMALIVLVAPTSLVEAKSKKEKLPKNNQKFSYCEEFDELVKESDGSGYWIVEKDKDGTKNYKPVVKVKKNGKWTVIHGSEMYLTIDKKTYYVDEDGFVAWNNPDNYEVSKYGYVIFPSNWKPGSKPKNGEKFFSKTFEEITGYGDGIWVVDKKGTKPVVIDNTGCRVAAQYFYLDIDGYLFYTDKNGYITKSNPDGLEAHKNGYLIQKLPGSNSTDTPTETTPDKTKPADTKPTSIDGYTIKKNGDQWICTDKDGNWVTGWVGDYYFTSWSGMSLGLTFIDGEYYMFSTDLSSLGKVLRNTWFNNMYFGKDGKALRNQQATINGKTYRFNDSGFLVTGWYNNEFYSSEPDRYGQLVPGVTK